MKLGPLLRLALLCGPGALSAQAIPATQAAGNVGPYDIPLFPTKAASDARARARLVFADSPFGVAVTTDGRAAYDVHIASTGLPRPDSLGRYSVYVAWEVSNDLALWHRLGVVTNGDVTVGHADLNKFLLVITAEQDSTAAERKGPVVLRGTSPSSFLQSFLTHPLFRGVSP